MMPIVLKTQFAVYFIKCCLLFSDGAGTKHKTPQHVRDRGRKGKGRTLNHVKLELKKIYGLFIAMNLPIPIVTEGDTFC